MPTKQSLWRKRQGMLGGRIQHHVDDAIYMPVGGRQGADVYSQATRDRGADCVRIETFAFNLAGFQHVFGQHLHGGLLTQSHPEALHPSEQVALRPVNLAEQVQ